MAKIYFIIILNKSFLHNGKNNIGTTIVFFESFNQFKYFAKKIIMGNHCVCAACFSPKSAKLQVVVATAAAASNLPKNIFEKRISLFLFDV